MAGGGLIKCNSSKICIEYTIENLNKGYYLNSDPKYDLNNPLLFLVSHTVRENEDGNKSILHSINDGNPEPGWYLNGDVNAEAKEKIIACSNRYNCVYKELKSTQCSNQMNGEFTSYYGGIRWCNGNNSEQLESKSVFIKYNRNNFVPGVNLPENSSSAYIKLDISSDKIIKSKDWITK